MTDLDAARPLPGLLREHCLSEPPDGAPTHCWWCRAASNVESLVAEVEALRLVASGDDGLKVRNAQLADLIIEALMRLDTALDRARDALRGEA